MSRIRTASVVVTLALAACSSSGGGGGGGGGGGLSPDSGIPSTDSRVAVYPGRTAQLHVARPSGITGAIRVSVEGLPVGVAATPIVIPDGESSGTITLTTSAPIRPGSVSRASLAITSAAASVTAGDGGMAADAGADSDAGVDVVVEVPEAGSGDETFHFEAVPYTSDHPNDGGWGSTAGIWAKVFPLPDLSFIYGNAAVGDFSVYLPGLDAGIRGVTLLHHFLPDGTWDRSFGQNGYVVADVRDPGEWADAPLYAVDSQQRTLVVNSSLSSAYSTTAPSIERFTATGQLDTSFGSGGRITTFSNTTSLRTLMLYPDDRILVVGFSQYYVCLYRFLPDGSPDPTFGTAGVVNTGLEPGFSSMAGALNPDGRITVAYGDPVTVSQFAADGTMDTSFGDGGTTVLSARTLGTNDSVTFATASNERIVVSAVTSNYSPYLAVLDLDGGFDTGFGGTGERIEPAPDGGFRFWSQDVRIDSLGRVYQGAKIYDQYSGQTEFQVRRFSHAGDLEFVDHKKGYWASYDLVGDDRLLFAGTENGAFALPDGGSMTTLVPAFSRVWATNTDAGTP